MTPTPNDPAMEARLRHDLQAAIAYADMPSDFTCGQAQALLERIEKVLRQHYCHPSRAVIEPPARAAIAMAVEALDRCMSVVPVGSGAEKMADAALTALRAHLAPAPDEPTDSEMMDWLEKNPELLLRMMRWKGVPQWWIGRGDDTYPDPRSAIRAAMLQQAKGEGEK